METKEIMELLEKELKALQEASEMCKKHPDLIQHLPALATAMTQIVDWLL